MPKVTILVKSLISLNCHQPSNCHTHNPNPHHTYMIAATTIGSLSPCIDSIPWGYSIPLVDASISQYWTIVGSCIFPCSSVQPRPMLPKTDVIGSRPLKSIPSIQTLLAIIQKTHNIEVFLSKHFLSINRFLLFWCQLLHTLDLVLKTVCAADSAIGQSSVNQRHNSDRCEIMLHLTSLPEKLTSIKVCPISIKSRQSHALSRNSDLSFESFTSNSKLVKNRFATYFTRSDGRYATTQMFS